MTTAMENATSALAITVASYAAVTLLDKMMDERNEALKKSEHFFGPLPYEQQFAKTVAERIQQYNDGLISSLELFELMYLAAFEHVE